MCFPVTFSFQRVSEWLSVGAAACRGGAVFPAEALTSRVMLSHILDFLRPRMGNGPQIFAILLSS